jgi:peptidoglycan/xylan/chitin deacetylase (PgdA/CDA1 family)
MTNPNESQRPTFPAQPLENDIWQGNASRKAVAFTFDVEGYTDIELPCILDLLDEYSSKGTFFIQGAWAQTNPDQLRDIVRRGHAIGNHSWSHKDMVHMDDSEIATELQSTEIVVQEIAGVTTKPYWRCPLGSRDAHLLEVVDNLGYLHGWLSARADPRDGDDPEIAVQFSLSRARNGTIYLYHPRILGVCSVIREVMQKLNSGGYAFHTLQQISAN